MWTRPDSGCCFVFQLNMLLLTERDSLFFVVNVVLSCWRQVEEASEWVSTSVYQLCSWWKEKKQTDRLTLVDVGGFYALFFLPTPASSWLVDFFFLYFGIPLIHSCYFSDYWWKNLAAPSRGCAVLTRLYLGMLLWWQFVKSSARGGGGGGLGGGGLDQT